jgi:hypothetical protein
MVVQSEAEDRKVSGLRRFSFASLSAVRDSLT